MNTFSDIVTRTFARNSYPCRLLSCLFALSFCTHSVAAEKTGYTDSLLSKRPSQGLWWNPARDGNYYLIAVGPEGLTYVTLNTQVNGKSQSFVMLGQLTDAPGMRAALSSPIYQRKGGGANASALDNLATESAGNAIINFSTANQAVLKLPDGSTEAIETFPLYTTAAASPARRIEGEFIGAIRSANTDAITKLAIAKLVAPRCAPESYGLNQSAFANLEISVIAGTSPRYQVLDAVLNCKPVGDLQLVDEMLELALPERGLEAVFYPTQANTLQIGGLPLQSGLYWAPNVDGYFWHVAKGPDGFGFVSINAFDANQKQTYSVIQSNIFSTSQQATIGSLIYSVQGGSAPGTALGSAPEIRALNAAKLIFTDAASATFLETGYTGSINRNIELAKLILAPQLSDRINATFADRNWLYLKNGSARAVRFNAAQADCGQAAGERLLQINDGSGQYFGVDASNQSVRFFKDRVDVPAPTIERVGRFLSYYTCRSASGALLTQQATHLPLPPLVCPAVNSCAQIGRAQFNDIGLDLIDGRMVPLPNNWRN